MSLDIEDVSLTLRRLLEEGGRPLVLEKEVIAPDVCAAPDGLLPLIVIAGEALWREAHGEGFGIKIEADAGALLECKLTQIDGAFAAVMLGSMEALAQAATPREIVIDELDQVWRRSCERFEAWRQEGDVSQ